MRSSNDKPNFETYLSPFTWRYGSEEMRRIWSEQYKRILWRRVWVALAKAQYKQGLLTKRELDDLVKHKENIDIKKAHQIEQAIKHDLMAEIKTYASQAKIGGGKLHWGATSMDIEDNVDVIRYKESLNLIEIQTKKLLKAFKTQINRHKETVCMGYTHLQPAEPTTLGYRFAFYAQDLLYDASLLHFAKKLNKGKGIKGAVGTSASFVRLLSKQKARVMEQDVMRQLGLDTVDISSQTAPRKLEWFVAIALSSLAQSLYKFAFDLRILQSPGFGELSEPFGKKQVGSSAMPFKKNPITAENICSLGRYIETLPPIALQNASHSYLERTLDDSANRRIIIPESFLAVDQMLVSATKIVEGLVIHTKKVQHNLDQFAPFAATESILIAVVKNGADRQKMHELLRKIAMEAWQSVQEGQVNPISDLLIQNKSIQKYISPEEIVSLLDVNNHIGDVAQRINVIIKSIERIT